jgi:hypothetical protein
MVITDHFMQMSSMNSIKFIPAYGHGIFDYVGGILLLLAPNLFGFSEYGGAAVTVPRVLGVAILGMQALSMNRVGLLKVISMSLHLMIDYVAGIGLAASPWLFGFADAPTNVWLPHVVVGLTILVVALLTRTKSETEAADLRADYRARV